MKTNCSRKSSVAKKESAQRRSSRIERSDLFRRNLFLEKPGDADSSGSDLGLFDDGPGLDLRGLHYGHGGLENQLCRWHGRLLHLEGGLVLVQSVEILLYRFNSCQ